jgi:hypothetical protein
VKLAIVRRRLLNWLQPMSGAVDPDLFSPQVNSRLFAQFGEGMARGTIRRDQLSRAELGRRAIAHYKATHSLLRIYGPLWLRSAVFVLPAFFVPIVWALRRTHQTAVRASVVGITHYPEFASYARDAGGPETLPVTSPKPALSRSDLVWFGSLLAECPALLLYPEILLRAVMRCGQYAALIRAHQCSAIVDFLEHSPTGPLAYGFCRSQQVELVNAMHGDRGYTVIFGFGVFSRLGIWGEFYRDLFKSLVVAAEQIELTPCQRHRPFGRLRLSSGRPRRIVVMYETTFAVGSPYLRCLADFLLCLDASWHINVRIRMRRGHERTEVPRFLAELRERLGERGERISLTDPDTTEMIDELTNACAAVAVYSSALMEAWLSGCRVVRIAPPEGQFKLYDPPYAASAAYHVYDGSSRDVSWLDAPLNLAREHELLKHVSLGAAEGASGMRS